MPVQPGNHSIGGLAVNFDRIRERTVSMVALNPVNRTVRGMPPPSLRQIHETGGFQIVLTLSLIHI